MGTPSQQRIDPKMGESAGIQLSMRLTQTHLRSTLRDGMMCVRIRMPMMALHDATPRDAVPVNLCQKQKERQYLAHGSFVKYSHA